MGVPLYAPSARKKHYQTFDSIKETDSEGREFWTSRKLSKILDYSEYRHFLPVVERAKEACKKSGHEVSDHFEEFLGMVEIGSGAKRKLERRVKSAEKKMIEERELPNRMEDGK